MSVSELGWCSLAEAESYFANERYPVTHWEDLADDDTKNRELNGAYNRLYYSKDFSLPAKGEETAAQLVILIKAQSEMAYYLALHLGDEDRRKGLQAQAVTTAGIVKEVFDKDKSDKVPIPPIVKELLNDFYEFTAPFYSVDIDRDENEAVSEDPTEF